MRRQALSLIPAGVLILGMWGCGRSETTAGAAPERPPEAAANGRFVLPPDSPKLRQIRTAAVETRQIPVDALTAPAVVEIDPNRLSRVMMPVPGRVRRVMVRLGDAVVLGQPVVILESPEADAAISSMSQAHARQRQRLSALAKAEKDLARAKLLFENRAAAMKDVINADNDLVQAQSDVQTGQAEEEAAKKRLELLGLKPDGSEREVTVRAPISGRVLEIAVAAGEYRTDTAASLMTVADLGTVWITSNVPEGSIRLVHTSEPVEIVLVAYPNETFRGRVTRIADTVDSGTRTVKVHAELPNPRGRFRPGMFGSIHHSHGLRSVPAVPAAAVVQGARGPAVYLERAPGVFERVAVAVEESRNGFIPVLAGVQAGERVVVEGALLLGGD